jgi:hypothetical protein
LAELNADELKRLARDFLVGRGGEAELEDTKRAMDAGPQLAMAMLQEMQAALDDASPAGFSPDQWKEVDTRVAALIQPLAKSAFGLGFIGKLFSGLFRKKPAAAASGRIKRKGAPEPSVEAGPAAPASAAPSSLITADAPLPPAAVAAEGPEGFEEMAPIATLAPLPSPPAPAAPAPLEAAPASEAAPEAPAPARAKRGKGLAMAALLILALGALGFGAWKLTLLLQSRKKAQPLPLAPPALPAPAPTPYSGPPRRLQPPASETEPLPSELPPMTPQPAGSVHGIPDLEAKDAQGRQGLPLP